MLRVSFTGYRPQKLGFFGEDDPMYIELVKKLHEKIGGLVEDGAKEFLSGMALGVDTICADIVLEFKKTNPNIRLTAVIPCHGQENSWTEEQKRHYYDLLLQCDNQVFTSENYRKGCMQIRNRYLVDNCDILLAVFDGKPGGTKFTVDYANTSGKKVIVVVPS